MITAAMADRGTNSRAKRPLVEDEDDEAPVEKRPRFPKGKKIRKDEGNGGGEEAAFGSWMNPELAAKERAKRRSQSREADLNQEDINSAEVQYEDNANLVDDGIRIEPFNLKQEREEGYFDADGNFVEYASRNEIKDAWLDSIEVYSRFTEKISEDKTAEDKYDDLSSEDIGKIKRNIANVLQPGETEKIETLRVELKIIQALKRLKGTSSGTREKMSEGTKRIFDQLTEDAMKLMENDVYHEERETFVREAEGHELIACGRGRSISSDNGILDTRHEAGASTNGTEHKPGSQSIWEEVSAAPQADLAAGQASSNDRGDEFDMFGEDEDGTADENMQTGQGGGPSFTSGQYPQVNSEPVEPSTSQNIGDATGGGFESDYTFDQQSGYYYSSSLGYYYDPNTGLYCCATTGKWYSFDEQTGAYIDCPSATSAMSAETNAA